MKIKKGDTVQVIRGKDMGKKGRVVKVLPRENKIIVEELNLVWKHVRPRREGEKGQRVQISVPFDVSKAMFVCPKCNRAIRVSYKILTDGKKVRWCRKCKEII